MNKHYLYILEDSDESFYFGVTNDIGWRSIMNASGLNEKSFTFYRMKMAKLKFPEGIEIETIGEIRVIILEDEIQVTRSRFLYSCTSKKSTSNAEDYLLLQRFTPDWILLKIGGERFF